jgi:hypothetical protein
VSRTESEYPGRLAYIYLERGSYALHDGTRFTKYREMPALPLSPFLDAGSCFFGSLACLFFISVLCTIDMLGCYMYLVSYYFMGH